MLQYLKGAAVVLFSLFASLAHAGEIRYFVDTESGAVISKPSELPAEIVDWLGPDLQAIGDDEFLPELKSYLRPGVKTMVAELEAATKEDVFGEALPYVLVKWWPHLIEVSLATNDAGEVLTDQVLFVHGDQASHYNTGRGLIKTAADARTYFKGRAPDGLEFGVIRRPEVQSPLLRTSTESAMLQPVFNNLADLHGFESFRVIAQSGAFPLMHDIAVIRGDIVCLVSASGVGDQLTFFRHYNENTSVVWAQAFLDPVGQVAQLPADTKVVVVHDPNDSTVVIASIEKYVDAAEAAGVDLVKQTNAVAAGGDSHDTVRAAAQLYVEHCATARITGLD